MKIHPMPLAALLITSCVYAEDPPAAPSYINEAPLPVGWPAPGPYDRVTEKKYPAYRAAFTTDQAEITAFWKLFRHITKNDIPMTAPVEMTMNDKEGKLRQASMAFLYQNEKVGKTGTDGKTVEVRDIPAATVLSYTWQGDDSVENIGKAKIALDATLKERGKPARSFRLLGYNGPGVPKLKRTWELQALFE